VVSPCVITAVGRGARADTATARAITHTHYTLRYQGNGCSSHRYYAAFPTGDRADRRVAYIVMSSVPPMRVSN